MKYRATIAAWFRDHELEYIRAVVNQHGGHRLRAAEALGISLSTLKRRLRTREGW